MASVSVSPTGSSQDASTFITSQWSLLQLAASPGDGDNLAFVSDPFPNNPVAGSNTTSPNPVLQINYPCWELLSGIRNGMPLMGLRSTACCLSYELAFDSDFNWGLRGGPNTSSCSGGSQPTGNDCFSTRLMWRTGGAGEALWLTAFQYTRTLLQPNNLCSQGNIICNSDFGISIDRGTFYFATGQWMRITMFVQMNDPPDVANGNLVLYFDDVQTISEQGLQFRSGTAVNVGGLYFSCQTLLLGSDDSWATPQSVNTYYRNFQLYGSSLPSNLTGQQVSSNVAPPLRLSPTTAVLAVLIAFALHLTWYGT
ncbi:polysaccharide lyase family 14 protein [Pisolithus microcarpus]|nr:polysaccharide lyase family 14 protein [Pisolithus microcarpus]